MRTCPSWILVVAVLAGHAPGAANAAASGDGSGVVGPADASLLAIDRIVLRLTPAAAARARSALRAGTPTAPRALRFDALGAADLDRAATELGGVRFAPEFPSIAWDEPLGTTATAAADLAAYWIAELPPGVSRDAALSRLRATIDVDEAHAIAFVAAEPPSPGHAATTAGGAGPSPGSAGAVPPPDDSLWSYATHLLQRDRHDVHALEAWELTRGDSDVLVAVLDTGVLPYHPDLGPSAADPSTRLWVNLAERGGAAGVDDDVNGYVDDVAGWDFVDRPLYPAVAGEDGDHADPDPNDYTGHGTAVAGVVAAKTGNGIGVAGAAPGVRVLPLRVGYSATIAPQGLFSMTWVAQAIVYAVQAGAAVINCSFASAQQPDLRAAVTYAVDRGVVVVSAAGNGALEYHYLGDREDVVAVAATESDDRVATFSNVGEYVDVAAPGSMLPTTSLSRPGADSLGLRRPDYTTSASGTSFAAPVASAGVALLQSARRAAGRLPASPLEVLLRLRETADDITAWNPGRDGYGSGRVNFDRLLRDTSASRIVWSRGPATVGAPAVAYEADGSPRVVHVLADRRLVVIDPASGSVVRSVVLEGDPLGGAATVRLGAGGASALFVATSSQAIAGFDVQLRPLPGWPTRHPDIGPTRVGMPALGDLDGDGIVEVVWASVQGWVHVWRLSGRVAWGFPARLGSATPQAAVALADVDGAPGLEILHSGSFGLRAVASTGSTVPGWRSLSRAYEYPPVVLRAASPIVVVSTRDAVYAMDEHGTDLWSHPLASPPVDDPAVADIDGDGVDEVLVLHDRLPWLTILTAGGAARDLAEAQPTRIPTAALVVGAVTTDGRPVALWRDRLGAVCGFDLLGRPVRDLPKPGLGGSSGLTLASLDGDAMPELAAGGATDGPLLLYALPSLRGFPLARGWVTARGNGARTGAVDGPVATMRDSVPPAAPSDVVAESSEPGVLRLAWRAPEGPATLERTMVTLLPPSGPAVTIARVAGAAAGAVESVLVSPIDEDTPYAIEVVAIDRWGSAGDTARVAWRSPGWPPAAVSDLSVTARSDTSLWLAWTASGDDGQVGAAADYQVAASTSPLDASNFDTAPIYAVRVGGVPSGQPLALELRGVGVATHAIAVRARDDGGRRSPLSNVVVAAAGVPPARVTDLRVAAATPRAVTLAWTAVGDDGSQGRASTYDVRAVDGSVSLDAAAFESATVRLTVPGVASPVTQATLPLAPGRAWRIALRAWDDAGNAGELSNDVAVSTPPAATSAAFRAQRIAGGARLTWSLDPPAAEAGVGALRVFALDPPSPWFVPLSDSVGDDTELVDPTAIPGRVYRLDARTYAGAWFELGRVALSPALAGVAVHPSPARRGAPIAVVCGLPAGVRGADLADLDVALLDAQGRRIETLHHGGVPDRIGELWLDLRLPAATAPGVYWVRLAAPSAGLAQRRKLVILR